MYLYFINFLLHTNVKEIQIQPTIVCSVLCCKYYLFLWRSYLIFNKQCVLHVKFKKHNLKLSGTTFISKNKKYFDF